MVRISPDVSYLGKIVIWIAIASRRDHPDFFGADSVAQLRQDAKLIADPVYPPIVINDGTAPSRWNHLIDRNILQWHEAASAIHLAPDPVEGRQDRPPHRVVRPELKYGKQAWQHAPVMIGPGTTHHLRSEEHTSELQSLMRTSYAVFCLKKKIHYARIARHTYIGSTHVSATVTNKQSDTRLIHENEHKTLCH